MCQSLIIRLGETDQNTKIDVFYLVYSKTSFSYKNGRKPKQMTNWPSKRDKFVTISFLKHWIQCLRIRKIQGCLYFWSKFSSKNDFFEIFFSFPIECHAKPSNRTFDCPQIVCSSCNNFYDMRPLHKFGKVAPPRGGWYIGVSLGGTMLNF